VRRHFFVPASLFLLLAIGSAFSTRAQQTVTAAKSGSAQPAPAAKATPTQKSEAPPMQTVAPVEDKGVNDRLPFMADSEKESHEPAPSATGLLLRTLGALLLIVGLIVAAAWGMKRFGGARFGAPKEDAPALAVLNSIALGERRSVAILRFGERTLLIGSTPQAVTLLAETVTEHSAPRMQSVADMLGQTSLSESFADELTSAEIGLDESDWKGPEAGSW
jgi:flagellar protein FliO/FliZ